jgi:putative tricarboxylic transport membrane protein
MKDWFVAAAAAVAAVMYLYADYNMPRLELGDPLGPRAFPALIGGLLLLSAVMLAVENWRRQPPPETATPPAGSNHYMVLVGMLIWTLVYYTAFEPVGYIMATVTYLFALLCFFNKGKHLTNVLVAAGFTAIAYTIFSQLLGVQLPPGPMGF